MMGRYYGGTGSMMGTGSYGWVMGQAGLVEQQARGGRVTEGMAWLTSALAVGTAAGSVAGGQVIDAGGARWGYVFAAACAAAAALACLAGLTLHADGIERSTANTRMERPPFRS